MEEEQGPSFHTVGGSTGVPLHGIDEANGDGISVGLGVGDRHAGQGHGPLLLGDGTEIAADALADDDAFRNMLHQQAARRFHAGDSPLSAGDVFGVNTEVAEFLSGRVKFTDIQAFTQGAPGQAVGDGDDDDDDDDDADDDEGSATQGPSLPVAGPAAASGSKRQRVGRGAVDATAAASAALAPAASSGHSLFGPLDHRIFPQSRSDQADFEEILTLTRRPKRARKTARKRKHDLPAALGGCMGEANSAYIRQDFDRAIELCKKVIKEAPYCADPYTTLGLVYSDMGDRALALKFKLVAAICAPEASVSWGELGAMSVEQGETSQALFCFERAVMYSPEDKESLHMRSKLQAQTGDAKRALEGHTELLQSSPGNLQLCTEMYQWVKQSEVSATKRKALADMAAQAISASLGVVVAESKQTEHVAILVDLFIEAGKFGKAVDTIQQNLPLCTYDGDVSVTDADPMTVLRWQIPAKLLLLFRVKLFACHLAMPGGKLLAPAILAPLFAMETRAVYSLLMEVVDLYIAHGEYRLALECTDHICACPELDKPVVWMKRAECFGELHEWEQSRTAYMQVTDIIPDHVGAQEGLAGLHRKQEQVNREQRDRTKRKGQLASERSNKRPREHVFQESMEELRGVRAAAKHQPTPLLVADIKSIHKMVVEYATRDPPDWDGVLLHGHRLSVIFFSRYRGGLDRPRKRHPRDADSIFQFPEVTGVNSFRWVQGTVRGRKDSKFLKFDENEQGEPLVLEPSELTIEQWFEVIAHTAEALVRVGRCEDGLAMAHRAQLSDRLGALESSNNRVLVFRWIKLLALEAMGVMEEASRESRALCMDVPRCTRVWNKFYGMTTKVGNCTNTQRFLLRLVKKEPDIPALLMAVGHHHLMSGTYMYAVGSYIMALKSRAEDPFITLCVGIGLLRMAMQRRVADRHLLVAQAFAYLFDYFELRGGDECQEACYNLGRAFHQVGILHLASHYYHKVLALPSAKERTASAAGAGSDEGDVGDTTNMKCEAAYQLAAISKASGSMDLARFYLAEYCTV